MSEIKPSDFGQSIVNTGNIATIAVGQTVSNAIETSGLPLLSVQMPSGFTSSDVTFLVSLDGITYGDLQDADALTQTLTAVPASGCVSVPTSWLAGWPFFKLQTSVAQVSEVEIILGLRRVS